MKRSPCIYYLKSSLSPEPRYIGQTLYPQPRLHKHVSQAVKARTHKENWICSVLAQGGTIEMVILETCARQDPKEQEALLNARETYWYEFYLLSGLLTNNHPPQAVKTWGIDRPARKPMSEETKEKIRQGKLGEKNPRYGKHPKSAPGTGKKISESLKNSNKFQQSRRSQEYRAKISKVQERPLVVLDEKRTTVLAVFPNCTSAAEFIGTAPQNVKKACADGRVIGRKYTTIRIKDLPEKLPNYKSLSGSELVNSGN